MDEVRKKTNPAAVAQLFENDELENLWRQVVVSDMDWIWARNIVQAGERIFLPDLSHKPSANIAKFSVAADGVSR